MRDARGRAGRPWKGEVGRGVGAEEVGGTVGAEEVGGTVGAEETGCRDGSIVKVEADSDDSPSVCSTLVNQSIPLSFEGSKFSLRCGRCIGSFSLFRGALSAAAEDSRSRKGSSFMVGCDFWLGEAGRDDSIGNL